MTQERIKRIHLIYSILLSIALVIAGVCLMAACLGIYHSGDQPFSRESVAAAFSKIALPVYLSVVMVAAGFLLDLFVPEAKKKSVPVKQYDLMLKRLHEKTDLDSCDESLRTAVTVQQRERKLHRIISGILLILGSAVFLSYAVNGSNYHQSEINASMIRAMYLLVPCMAIPFGYAVFSAFYSAASIRKELDLLKTAGTGKASRQTKAVNTGEEKRLAVFRFAVLALGVVLLVYGFATGGMADVLAKAVNICTECVGLG